MTNTHIRAVYEMDTTQIRIIRLHLCTDQGAETDLYLYLQVIFPHPSGLTAPRSRIIHDKGSQQEETIKK